MEESGGDIYIMSNADNIQKGVVIFVLAVILKFFVSAVMLTAPFIFSVFIYLFFGKKIIKSNPKDNAHLIMLFTMVYSGFVLTLALLGIHWIAILFLSILTNILIIKELCYAIRLKYPKTINPPDSTIEKILTLIESRINIGAVYSKIYDCMEAAFFKVIDFLGYFL